MRTISNAQSAVLSESDRADWVRVLVYVDAAWVDLTDHFGINWLVSATYGESQDGSAMDASVKLHLADHDLNLSPFMTTNLINVDNVLLALGNAIRIDAAVMPMGSTPGASDWMEVFRGEIDGYDIKTESITLRCRDQSVSPSDAFIEKEKWYGDGTDQVEEVIQDILDEWPMPDETTYLTLYSINGTGGTPWNAGDSPGWAIAKYRQKREPVYDAIRAIAQTLGYDLRYRWQDNTASFELIMWEPDRAAAGGVDRSFATSDYYKIESATLSRRFIRNVCTVGYTDSDDNRQVSTDTDAASVTAYGRRWVELNEAVGSQINSSGEADALAEACVDDLKDPTITVTMTLPFFPWAQLQDYYTIAANGVQFDAAQSLSVIEIRHSVSKDSAVTTLTLEGKPKLSKKKWLTQQRPNKKITLDSTNVTTSDSQSNLCPNGGLTQWDGF